MKYKENWSETKERFTAWWNQDKMDRPLMRIIARLKEPREELEAIQPAGNYRDGRLNVERQFKKVRNMCRTHSFLADAFPDLSISIGPGSMATYLGSEPEFKKDTVWYTECIHDWKEWSNFTFDPDNYWWKHHLEIYMKARQLAQNEFVLSIPDIIENIDIISAMRGPQNTCYDLIDVPEIIKSHINQIDELYFKYYDEFYNIVKMKDESSCYTHYNIWGPGKTAKIQCDFSALMSPEQFREFIVPSLEKQCRRLDCSLYHLDGPEAIRHLDALMEIKELKALQWTPGAGKPDGTNEQWFPIYEKVKKAGKSLWIRIKDGSFEDWIRGADRVVKAIGNQHLYFLFPDMEEEEARKLMAAAEDRWT